MRSDGVSWLEGPMRAQNDRVQEVDASAAQTRQEELEATSVAPMG